MFMAFIDQNLIPQWWGPKRLATSVVKMDVRPGGIWRFVQRDSDGNEYIFNGSYHEIVPPKRLVYTFEFEGMPGHVIVETVTFEEEHGSKTRLISKTPFQRGENRDIMVDLLRVGGGRAESKDRLADILKYLKNIHRGHHDND
ncbi:MAG TPA: SRPBCC domain-containing protein [Nitrososphaera sp.]